MLAQQRADRGELQAVAAGRVAAGERQLERELVEAVGARDVAQPRPPSSGPSGVRSAAPRPGDDDPRVADVDAGAGRPPRRDRSSASRSGAAKSASSSSWWTNVPTWTPAGIVASGEGTASRAASPSGRAGASRSGRARRVGAPRPRRRASPSGRGGAASGRGGAASATGIAGACSSVTTPSSGSLVTSGSCAAAVMSL